ncbi:MAG: DUF6531 domain-containing protein, partial [Acidobacteriota bacterium]
ASAQQSIHVTVPVSAGLPADGDYQLHRFVDVLGQRGFMLHSFLRLDGQTLTDAPIDSNPSSQIAAVEKSQAPESTVYPPPPRQRPWPYDQARQLADHPNFVLSVENVAGESAAPPVKTLPGAATGLEKAPAKSVPLGPADYLVGVTSPGRYRAVRATIALSYLAYPAIQPDLAAWNDAFSPPMISWITPELFGRGHRHLLLPTPRATSSSSTADAQKSAAGADADVTVGDVATGLILLRDQRPAPSEAFTRYPSDVYPDSSPPTLLSSEHFQIVRVPTDFAASMQIRPGITVSRNGTQLTVRGEAGAAGGEVQAVLWSHLDGFEEARTVTAASGSFELKAPSASVGPPLLLAIGSKLSAFDEPILEFSEAVVPNDFDADDEVPGVLVHRWESDKWRFAPVSARVTGHGEKVRLVPTAGFQAGRYRLEINEDLQDMKEIAWAGTFHLEFEVLESAAVGEYDLPKTADMARFGQLLVVAASDRGLQVLDASHPKVVRPYLGHDQGFTLTAGASVRGVEVDPHGFAYFVGGGESSFGVLKVLDLLALTPNSAATEGEATAAFAAAQRGSIMLSYAVNTGLTTSQLPEGLPRRVAVASHDTKHAWTAGETAPVTAVVGQAVDPFSGDATWTISGAGTADRPVTLRNLTRGRFERVMASASGDYTLQILAAPGDRLELLVNQGATAYVTVDGAVETTADGTVDPDGSIAGLAAIDIVNLWGRELNTGPTAAPDVKWPKGAAVDYPDCDPARVDVDPTPRDVDVLWQNGKVKLAAMITGFGARILESSGNPLVFTRSPGGDACAAVAAENGLANITGMASVDDYGLDLDGDGTISPGLLATTEYRDYVVLAHHSGYLKIFDATDSTAVKPVAEIPLAKDDEEIAIADLAIDRASQLIYVTAFGAGVYVVDFSSLPPETTDGNFVLRIDADGDGLDDRVLEHIQIVGEEARTVVPMPESGLVWAGGRLQGIKGLLQSPPELVIAPATGALARVAEVAPFGVPTAERDGVELPGAVRLFTGLPGLAASADQVGAQGSTLKVELLSTAPEGDEIDGLTLDGAPPTSYKDSEALELRRMADRPYEDGYGLYLSEPVVLIADLRASIAYDRTPDENDPELCRRCDQVDAGVYAAPPPPAERRKELLSGHRLTARFAADNPGLESFYEAVPVLRQGTKIASAAWDLSPSIDQEPANNPSLGFGEAVGTLLHSGEFTHDAVDLTMQGLGIPFVMARTFRHQNLGEGPLGPGWDFAYGKRLRPLPNGDVDYFNGRGRRETFTWTAEQGSPNRFESPEGVFALLQRHGDGYTLFDRQGLRWLFDGDGRLRSIYDASKVMEGPSTGTEVLFDYDGGGRLSRVTSVGRSLRFAYAENGRLESVRDDTGRDVRYAYDAAGRLEVVSSPEASLELSASPQRLATTYAYGAAAGTFAQRLNARSKLESITDARGETWLELTYGSEPVSPRVERQTWGGDDVTLAYAGTTTTVTDRRGEVFLFNHTADGHLKSYTEPATTDPNGQPATGATSTTWEYGYGHGLPTSSVLPDGRTFEWSYVEEAVGEEAFGALNARAGAAARPNVDLHKRIAASSVASHEPATAVASCQVGDANNGSASVIQWAFEDYHYRSHQPKITTSPRGHQVEGRLDEVSGLSKGSTETVSPGSQTIDRVIERDARGLATKRTLSGGGVGLSSTIEYVA